MKSSSCKDYHKDQDIFRMKDTDSEASEQHDDRIHQEINKNKIINQFLGYLHPGIIISHNCWILQ